MCGEYKILNRFAEGINNTIKNLRTIFCISTGRIGAFIVRVFWLRIIDI